MKGYLKRVYLMANALFHTLTEAYIMASAKKMSGQAMESLHIRMEENIKDSL